jgi:hypothetical protein
MSPITVETSPMISFAARNRPRTENVILGGTARRVETIPRHHPSVRPHQKEIPRVGRLVLKGLESFGYIDGLPPFGDPLNGK